MERVLLLPGRQLKVRMGNGTSFGQDRMIQSTPVSPYHNRLAHTPNSFEVNGLAESLIGGVLAAQGLGKYCDPQFVGYTAREMQEALDMTPEEMNIAAHQILSNEAYTMSTYSGSGGVLHSSPTSYSPVHTTTSISPISNRLAVATATPTTPTRATTTMTAATSTMSNKKKQASGQDVQNQRSSNNNSNNINVNTTNSSNFNNNNNVNNNNNSNINSNSSNVINNNYSTS